MECPRFQALVEYAEGRPGADALIGRHVATCEKCTTALDELRAMLPTPPAKTIPSPAPFPQVVVALPTDVIPTKGTLIGRYLVLEAAAQGGMGMVFSAYDPELHRRVAIKLVRFDLASSELAEAMRERFRREAQAMARLSHPNVVTVYDVGTYGPSLYIAMEWVEGVDLFGWQEAAPRDPKEILAHYLEAGRGLAAAHAAGIVHRDFKPANVLLGKDGRVRVTDFGLARTTSKKNSSGAGGGHISLVGISIGDSQPELTAPGHTMGTPGYMAPEQILGERADARSDQFNFCATLYEALYGRLPFEGEDYTTQARNVLAGNLRPPEPTDRVPRYLWPVFQRGLHRYPDQRFPDMNALLTALADDPRQRRRERLGVGLIGLLVLGVLLGLGLGARTIYVRERNRCARLASGQMSIWSPAKKEQLHKHLTDLGLPDADVLWEHTVAQIDAYVQGWLQLQTATCEAMRTAGDTDPLRRQSGCLAARHRELQITLDALSSADTTTAHLGPELMTHLEPAASCEVLEAPGSSPNDEELNGSMARVQLLFDEDRFEAGEKLAAEVAALAQSRNEPGLQAQAYYWEARLVWNGTENLKRTEELLVKAERAAEEAGDDEQIAKIRIERFYVVSVDMNEVERGRQLQADAEAAVSRVGSLPLLRAKLLDVEASVDSNLGNLSQATLKYQQALELEEHVAGVDSTVLPEVLDDLADSYLAVGDYTRARPLYERALEIHRRTVGPEHANVAAIEGNEANLYLYMHNPAAALPLAEHAVHVLEAKENSEKDPYYAWALGTLGHTLIDLGRADEGRRLAQRAYDMEQTQVTPDGVDTGSLLLTLGRDDLRRGNASEARPKLERALSNLERHKQERYDLASTRFALAKSLEATGGDMSRARLLATQARDGFAAAVDGDRQELAEVELWLHSHAGPVANSH
jgi:tetratricopeptide (TPR) repeat protein